MMFGFQFHSPVKDRVLAGDGFEVCFRSISTASDPEYRVIKRYREDNDSSQQESGRLPCQQHKRD